eukprot:9288201-Heterocapsa_arctica.AAC.1
MDPSPRRGQRVKATLVAKPEPLHGLRPDRTFHVSMLATYWDCVTFVMTVLHTICSLHSQICVRILKLYVRIT